jgi:predicted dehydrogenase
VRAQRLLAGRDYGDLIQAALFVNYACWSHCIDLLHLFAGRAALISALAGEATYQDAVDVAASFCLASGATGTILGTSGSKFVFPLYEMLFNFERGSIRFSDLDAAVDVYDASSRYKESHPLIGNHSRWDQYQDSFQKSLAAYLDAICRGDPPPVPGLAGLEELQFEAALRRSIAQKRPVDVQQEFPLA